MKLIYDGAVSRVDDLTGGNLTSTGNPTTDRVITTIRSMPPSKAGVLRILKEKELITLTLKPNRFFVKLKKV